MSFPFITLAALSGPRPPRQSSTSLRQSAACKAPRGIWSQAEGLHRDHPKFLKKRYHSFQNHYSHKISETQKYPQYCWEFHDRLWEALSGSTSEKRSVPSRTGGERILEMLWKPQMIWIIGFGGSQPYSWGEFQETLWERFRGLSGVFPEFFRNFFRKVPAVLGYGPETGRIRFRGVRFQTPNSVSFLGLTEFRGECLSAYDLCDKVNSPSFSQNSPSLPQNSVRLSEFSSPKQYSRNSVPPVS